LDDAAVESIDAPDIVDKNTRRRRIAYLSTELDHVDSSGWDGAAPHPSLVSGRVKARIGSDGEQIAKRVGDHRQRVRCRVLDVVPVAKRRSARIASWCSAIDAKLGSSLSAGNLHSPVAATGAVAAAAGRHAGKQAAAG
jgi:hypothetical protein